MKLLLDQGLPRSTAKLLREDGIDTTHVGEIGLSSAADHEILHRGRKDGCVVVTLDADFHSLLAFSGGTSPSVIRLRIEGLNGQRAAILIKEVVSHSEEELSHGALVTVQPGRIRIRRLPLSL
jgi:predicted nuclease of predicted toxin-antitoxin system